MRYFLVIIFAVMVGSLSAQQFIPTTSTIRTPYGNVTNTTYRYQPGFNNNYGSGSGGQKYKFTVVISDDSIITSKTRIQIEDRTHSVPMKVKKGVMRNIFPKETKEIYRILPNGKKFSGIPADTCWLFPAVTGKINGYTDLPREGCLYLIAFQLDNSPILPLTRKNLETMIGPITDPKLLELLDKGNLSEVVRQYNRDFQ